MNLLRGKYRSRKTMKQALGLGHTGHESHRNYELTRPMFQRIVNRLKSAFGASKHRKARVARFQSRQRSKR